jgi:hypothetical protein
VICLLSQRRRQPQRIAVLAFSMMRRACLLQSKLLLSRLLQPSLTQGMVSSPIFLRQSQPGQRVIRGMDFLKPCRCLMPRQP